MRRSVLIVLLGLVGGLAAHVGWFTLRRPSNSIDEQLAWMRAVLQLEPDQFAQFKAMHQEIGPHLLLLATELQQARSKSDAFERRRETTGEVDFVAFARLVEQRRALDRDRTATSRKLIDAAMNVMTPDQRQRYLALIAPALNPDSDSNFH